MHLIKDYVSEAFEPTLLLAFLCSLVGIAAAASYGSINLAFSALVVVGAVLAQMSVNLINDYQDYASGIDRENTKTKFSGGSALVSTGAVKHRHVLYMGIAAAVISGLIGIFFAIAVSTVILLLVVVGAIAIFLYTKYMMRFPLLPEPFVMFAFSIVGVGSYIVAHGSLTGLGLALFAIVPAGMLGGIALLVNEVPDAEIDKKYGRKHAVIVLSTRRRVSYYYIALMSITYAIVIFGVTALSLTPFLLLALATFPVIGYVASGMRAYKNPQGYEKYMAANVVVIVVYLMLLIVAYSL